MVIMMAGLEDSSSGPGHGDSSRRASTTNCSIRARRRSSSNTTHGHAVELVPVVAKQSAPAGIFGPDEPLVHAFRGLELPGMVQLNLSSLKERLRKERARREYIPWFVQGKLPEEVDSQMAASRAHPMTQHAALTRSLPASPQGKLPVGKGLHAALIHAIGPRGKGSAAGRKSSSGAAATAATLGLGYNPAGFVEVAAAHAAGVAYNAGIYDTSGRGMSRTARLALRSLHNKLAAATSAPVSPGRAAQDMKDDLPRSQAVSTPPIPLSTREARMRWGDATPRHDAHSIRTAPHTPASAWRTWAPAEPSPAQEGSISSTSPPPSNARTPRSLAGLLSRVPGSPAPDANLPPSPTRRIFTAPAPPCSHIPANSPVKSNVGGGFPAGVQQTGKKAHRPSRGSESPTRQVEPHVMRAATKLMQRMDEEWSAMDDEAGTPPLLSPRPNQLSGGQLSSVFAASRPATRSTPDFSQQHTIDGRSVLAQVASRAAAMLNPPSTAPARLNVSKAALLASRQGGGLVFTGKTLALLRAQERSSKFVSLEPEQAGPTLLEDWRMVVLQHPSATRPCKPRASSGRPRVMSGRSRASVPKPGAKGRPGPAEHQACMPASAGQAGSASAAHPQSQPARVHVNVPVRVSEVGATLWAKLRALGLRRVLTAGNPTDAAQLHGLSMIQTLQGKTGLAGQARLRMQALERVTPGLQGKASQQPQPHAVGPGADGMPSPIGTPRDPVLPGDQRQSNWLDDMFSGTYGSADALRARLKAQNEALVFANPVAFNEETALQADAEHRAALERAAERLAKTQDPVEVAHHSEHRLVGALHAAVHDLHTARPFFHSPVVVKTKIKRAAFEKVSAAAAVKEPWTLEKSIFALRKRECDARACFDNDQVKKGQFKLDWERIASKVRFRKLVAREDKSVSSASEGLDEELSEIRQELEDHRDVIRSAFNYYSMMSGAISHSSVLTMGLNQWLGFCTDVQLIMSAAGKRGATSGDLQTIFVAVNFEEESATQESQANDDDAMMRFEFIEGLVRAAIGRFIVTKQCDDASDAVHMLIQQIILPAAPPEALLDPNEFREKRFYCEDMDLSIQAHMDILQACFKMYKAKDRSKYMSIENWAAFADGAGLLGKHTGVENREVKLIFVWSQMMVADELKRRKRATCLVFFDFLEALARLADLISPPPIEDVKTWLAAHHPEFSLAPGACLLSEYYKLLQASGEGEAQKRDSAELVAPPSRPLVVKFNAVMEVVVARMMAAWGGANEQDCAARMRKTATQISGGVELG